MRSFIDTSVLVYADASDEPAKQAVAVDLIARHLRDGNGVISTQVLHEFVNAALHKLALPVPTVRERLRVYARFETVGASAAAAVEALDLHATQKLSFWDDLIVNAARQAGGGQLFSEDLQSGGLIVSVRVVNPFLAMQSGRPESCRTTRLVTRRQDLAGFHYVETTFLICPHKKVLAENF